MSYDGSGQRILPLSPARESIATMSYSTVAPRAQINVVAPAQLPTTCTYDYSNGLCRAPAADVVATVTLAYGEVIRPTAAQRLEIDFLRRLDALLADAGSDVNAFWTLLTQHGFCKAVWVNKTSDALGRRNLRFFSVLAEAQRSLFFTLLDEGPRVWLAAHRRGFVGWFSGVAFNMARNAVRKLHRLYLLRHKLGKLRRADVPLAEIADRSREENFRIDLLAALKDMPRELRRVFFWRRRNVPFKAMAERLGVSVSTAKRRWDEARCYLRRRLASYSPGR